VGFLLPRAATIALAVSFLATGALAQGVVDQSNDPASTAGFGCGTDIILNGTIHQSFVPAMDNLIAVELRLQAGSSFPSEGATLTARVRADSSTGQVLSEATASVAGPLTVGTQGLVRFDFEPLSITPGNTYVIEWVTPTTNTLTWVGSNSNPYSAGTAFSCSGNAWPGGTTDFNFITYAAAVVEEAPEAPEAPEAEPTCEERLARLRAAVDDVPAGKVARARMAKILDLAIRKLERGKPHAAAALVRVFEVKVRFLMRFDAIPEGYGEALVAEAEAVRACLRDCDDGKCRGHRHGRDRDRDHDDDGDRDRDDDNDHDDDC
jgi:hypothetical protein